jgi:hypothetical protein
MSRLTLSAHWLERSIGIGKQRFAFAERMGWVNYGAQQAREEFDINGCVAEAGGGKRFNLPWHANVGVIDGVDVGKIIEIRGRRPYSDLGIRPWHKDKRELPHVLVWVYEDYSMDFRGWLYGHEGMHHENPELHRRRWSASSMCWYNPPPYRPLEELDRILADDAEVERIYQRHLIAEPLRKAEERRIREEERRARVLKEHHATDHGVAANQDHRRPEPV